MVNPLVYLVAHSALSDHGLELKFDQCFASVRSIGMHLLRFNRFSLAFHYQRAFPHRLTLQNHPARLYSSLSRLRLPLSDLHQSMLSTGNDHTMVLLWP